ncbi:hypothetical protein ACH4F6_15715 [Streptomyces sp. NPDC017936]|uniref:hypothetical protein n=1 Tax=Streptomyces sp. NPDC017936 TaxID=3365016 RepID=UPI0037BDFB83
MSISLTGRPTTFTDPRLHAAIVDRLTFSAPLVGTGTGSHRPARTKAHRTNRTNRTK